MAKFNQHSSNKKQFKSGIFIYGGVSLMILSMCILISVMSVIANQMQTVPVTAGALIMMCAALIALFSDDDGRIFSLILLATGFATLILGGVAMQNAYQKYYARNEVKVEESYNLTRLTKNNNSLAYQAPENVYFIQDSGDYQYVLSTPAGGFKNQSLQQVYGNGYAQNKVVIKKEDAKKAKLVVTFKDFKYRNSKSVIKNPQQILAHYHKEYLQFKFIIPNQQK